MAVASIKPSSHFFVAQDHNGKGFVTLPNMQDVFGGGGWDVAEMLREVTGSGDEAITSSQVRKHMCVEDDEVVD